MQSGGCFECDSLRKRFAKLAVQRRAWNYPSRTAFGPVDEPPEDGVAPTGLTVLESPVDVTVGFIGANTPESAYIAPAYAALAPGLVGVDQMNFQIPQGTLEGCSVPVVLYGPLTRVRPLR